MIESGQRKCSPSLCVAMDITPRSAPQFVVGDLVFFLGYYKNYHEANEYGVVLSVDEPGAWQEMVYHVFWFDRAYSGQYSGGQLVLVYEIDPQTKNITLNKW